MHSNFKILLFPVISKPYVGIATARIHDKSYEKNAPKQVLEKESSIEQG